jgi:hypothetical protein
MASYGSYKKIIGGQIKDGTVPNSALATGAGLAYNVKHIYGQVNVCTPGCCCLWTVPTGVKRVTFELWGSGGNGHGNCSCNRCHHYQGAGGGFYNSKTISVQSGWTYTICAGGVYRCCSRECVGCRGCSSYVNGCGLSNFCAIGGSPGRANTAWETLCYSYFDCCISPNANNGDFGMGNHIGSWSGPRFCHCMQHNTYTTNAPFLAGGIGATQNIGFCWSRCGCWHVPYGTGAQGGMTNYCERCCGQGGTGGGGLVKITYV